MINEKTSLSYKCYDPESVCYRFHSCAIGKNLVTVAAREAWKCSLSLGG